MESKQNLGAIISTQRLTRLFKNQYKQFIFIISLIENFFTPTCLDSAD